MKKISKNSQIKVLHFLPEEIIYDARVKKELAAIKNKLDISLHLLYYSSLKNEHEFTDKDIVIRPPGINRHIKKIKPVYWIIKGFHLLISLFMILKNNKYDIIHVHNIQGCSMLLYIRWATCNRHTTIIYDTHELFSGMKYDYRLLEYYYKALEPIILKKVDYIIHANESRMIYSNKTYNLDPQKSIYVNNYYDNRKEKMKSVIPILEEFKKKNKKIVIYQGVVNSGRNLMRIIQNIFKGMDNKILIVIGDGSELGVIKSYIETNNLESKIIIVGQIPNEILADYTAYGDLGIVTYANDCLNNYFCASNKVSEYVSCRVPILGIDFPEISKLVEKYKIGNVFREDDLENFGNIVDQCLIEFPFKIDADTHKNFFDFINWNKESEKLTELYNKIESKDKSRLIIK